MTAVILAAGVGKRMGANAPPKCLLRIGGRSLLQITLEALRAVGVNRIVLVVGYQQEAVTAEARVHSRSTHLIVLENPRFREGAILSLWSARDFFDDNLLIMDADVFCPPAALTRLVGSIHPNCILVDGSSPDTGEEQIVLGKGSRVLHITKRPSQEMKASLTAFGESIGFLKLSKKAAQQLRVLLEEKVDSGAVNIEHEQVYPDLFQKEIVGFERMDGLLWTEIDTPEDLERAEKEILPKWSVFPCVNRMISGWFLPWVLRFPLTPNQWTLISLLCGLAAIGFLATGSYRGAVVGAFLFQLFYVVDNWDGEVARWKGLSSKWGGWFDVAADGVVQILLPIGIALGLKAQGEPSWVMGLGWAVAVGIAMDFLVVSWAKIRGFGPCSYGDPARIGRLSSGSGLIPWVRANLTNENFSLVVVFVLLMDWRLPFLLVGVMGTQVFWMAYLWRERQRLFVAGVREASYSFAQARR